MGIMDMILGFAKTEKLETMIKNGAIVIDVRSKEEFRGGHVAGSTNIPLNELAGSLDKIKKMDKPIIVCCASGGRSAQAKRILKGHGLKECENGGGWMRVNSCA